jgi:hypothetical protein
VGIKAGFLGIDLTSAEAKPSACLGLDRELHLIYSGFLYISRLLPNIAPYVDGFSHHLCDAAIAAYTAYLHYQGKTELWGEPEEGVICLPFLDRVAYAT